MATMREETAETETEEPTEWYDYIGVGGFKVALEEASLYNLVQWPLITAFEGQY